MSQIRRNDVTSAPARWRAQLVRALRWWAEHQAWPATEDVRIDWRGPSCR